MNIEEIKRKVASDEYSFLRDNPHLGNNIIMLCLGGSHAYGTNVETSDLDVRGCALNSKAEILARENFEQVVNRETDTTIYSFNKLIDLLLKANPNVLECLGLKQEHYLYLSPIGQELLDNADMFLSKKVIQSFGGYATAQLRRLDNKSARSLEQAEKEAHILNSVKNATVDFKNKFFEYPEDAIKLYIDDAVNDEYDKEIFMDVNLTHYPLRDYKSMWSALNNVVKDYAKLEQTGRNREAIRYDKLGKHMCHLVRLYFMCFDILEHGKIVTYREAEHDFLMDIRNGKYLDDNNQPISEFFEIVDELEKRLEYDKIHTELPEKPDYNRIKEFTMSVNERIVKDEIDIA
jgi:predicted nucleotidyltransferase